MVEPCQYLVTQGDWLVIHTLSKADKEKVLVQLINLRTNLILFPNHTTIADLFAVCRHSISEAQPGVEVVCAPLQAVMSSFNKPQYKSQLEQLAIPFQGKYLPTGSTSSTTGEAPTGPCYQP